MTTICPKCGHKVNTSEQYCRLCGYVLHDITDSDKVKFSTTKFCVSCGKEMNVHQLYCRQCSNDLNKKTNQAYFSNKINGQSRSHNRMASIILSVIAFVFVVLSFFSLTGLHVPGIVLGSFGLSYVNNDRYQGRPYYKIAHIFSVIAITFGALSLTLDLLMLLWGSMTG